MRSVVPKPAGGGEHTGSVALGEFSSLIDEIVRESARRMLAQALQSEVDVCIARFAAERDEHGRRLVVRNGYHESREVITSAGAVAVRAPRGGPPGGSRDRRTPATPLGDRATVGAQDPKGH